MIRKCVLGVLGLVLFCLPVNLAQAAPVIITLDDVPDVAMGETWYESGAAMNMFGSFGSGGGGVWLLPGLLIVNFSDIASLMTSIPVNVEVDIVDGAGVGAMGAFLYDDGTLLDVAFNTLGGSAETLFLTGGPGANSLIVTAYEGFVDEIRLAPVPIPGAIWLLGSGLIGLVGIRRKYRN